jgi:hypothetical protein
MQIHHKGKIVLSVIASACLLAGCNPGSEASVSLDSLSGSGEGVSSTSVSHQDTTSESVSVAPVKHVIRIRQTSGLTITPSVTSAEKGETVELSISASEGYALTHLYLDATELSVSEGKASFVMPDDDVIIKATVSVSGNFTIGGDVAAVLSQEGSVYVAHDIAVASSSNIYFQVNTKKFGYDYLNLYKTFADVQSAFASSSDTTVNLEGRDVMLEVAGNASYDFIYDPSDATYPLSIVRTKVTAAPTNSDQLESLFAGKAYSESTVNPQKVNHVEFFDTISSNHYVYDKYEKGSFATVTLDGNDSPYAYVYKALEGNKLTVVDNYIENVQTTDPYGISDTYYADESTAAKEDTTKYSGRYGLDDTLEEGWQFSRHSYATPLRDGEFYATSFSHSMAAIDLNQYAAYRDSFTIEDDLKFANCTITSETASDGSFVTTIKSYKTYDPTDSTYHLMSVKTHIEYNVTMAFNADGSLLSGTYKEMKYGEDAFNFSTNAFKDGGESLGKLVKRFVYKYTYGDAKAGTPAWSDLSKYLASGISAVIKGEDASGKATDNTVIAGDRLDDRADETNLLAITPTPSTALDSWEYGLTDTADTTMVTKGEKGSTKGWETSSEAEGTVNLTVSNYYDGSNAVTVPLTLVVGTYHSLFINDVNNTHELTATSATMKAGSKIHLALDTSPAYKRSLKGITIAYDKEGVVNASIDVATRLLWLDAISATITAATTVNLTLNSSHYAEGFGPTVISVTVNPGTPTKINADYLVGTWKPLKEDTLELDFTANETTTSLGTTARLGTLKADGDSFVFRYLYDDNTYNWDSYLITSHAGTTYAYETYELFFDIDYDNNYVGVCLVGYTASYSTSDATYSLDKSEAIIGGANATIDTDGISIEPTSYLDFAKAA